MPEIRKRTKLSNSRTLLTPYFMTLEDVSQVNPLVRFVVEYSMPLARSRRTKQDRTVVEFKLAEEAIPTEFWEGNVTRISVNRYERDPVARQQCLSVHGTSCFVCGMSFGETYGELAKGFIHVHHLVAVSKRKTNYQVNPETDLVPVCPNCHAVIHRCDPPVTVDEMRAMVAEMKQG
jgi:predicted HNH restriction endonuclease